MRNTRREYIQFNKTRNLGSLLGDTINFLKIEGAPFFATVFKISAIPIVLAIAFGVYYDLYELSRPLVYNESFLGRYSFVTDWEFLLATLFETVAYGFIAASAYSYIKSYWENKGTINETEISRIATQKAFSSVGLYILSLIVIRVGLLFLVIPGIYLGVVLSIAGCLLIFEERDVSDSFGHSFEFMKGYWWETFGCLLVYGILIVIIGIILNLPLIVYTFNDLFGDQLLYTVIQDLSQDPIYMILLGFARCVELFFTLVSFVFAAFVYFDIYEQKHPSRDEIDFIGIK